MICEAVARSASPEAAAAATATAKEIWGTWEDLLLACAVSRLGVRTWDSVAAEVRSRSPAASSVFTPDACRRRYRHLQNRFSAAAAADDDEADTADEVPWLEELRKIRVAELRREVQRSDVSIGSLQLKAKRLREEREQTLRRAAANGEGVSDLKLEDDHKDVRSPGSAPADQISGGDSGRSCKESNSTDPKGGGNDGEKPPPPPREAADDPCLGGQGADLAGAAGEEKSAGESSYNGSSDTIARGAAAGRSPLTESSPALPQEVGESGESFAESKDGEAEGAKESSDVQSSAGLSRRRRGRRRKAVPRRPGGEREPGEASAWAPVESQPLLAFLEIICSHECGFVFESRLKSQESAGYRGLVLRHVDLEMVRGRIMAGGYARAEFFRDLLLICNNAIVYFAKGSPESTAAVKLRQLVNKEISATLTKPSSPLPPPPPQPEAKKEATPPPSQLPLSPPPAPKLKPEADLVRPSKPGPLAAPPMIACKKRSSIATKPALMKKERDTKEERDTKKATETKEEEERDNKNERENKKEERDMRSADTLQKENCLPKEKAKERTVVAGTRGPRTNKSRGNKGGREMGKSLANPKPVATSTAVAAENSTPEPVGGKAEKKGVGGAATVAKKRSAAIFLDRLNRVSPTAAKRGAASSKGALAETLKSSAGNGNGGAKGTEQKKGGGGRKEQEGHQGSAAAKHAATEQTAVPVKRSVGRPPKRVAPPPVPPPAKRTREEKRATLPPSRKRTRR